MTLKLNELVRMGFKEVHVLSYGYESAGIFSHYEPFGKKREFIFKIVPLKSGAYLEHKWLFFINEDEEYYYVKDGQAYCDDPELKECPD